MSSFSGQRLVERFKSSFHIFENNYVFGKGIGTKHPLRSPQLEYTRFPRAAFANAGIPL